MMSASPQFLLSSLSCIGNYRLTVLIGEIRRLTYHSEIGYQPKITLTKGLQRTADWSVSEGLL